MIDPQIKIHNKYLVRHRGEILVMVLQNIAEINKEKRYSGLVVNSDIYNTISTRDKDIIKEIPNDTDLSKLKELYPHVYI
jgi:hypothetical protein